MVCVCVLNKVLQIAIVAGKGVSVALDAIDTVVYRTAIAIIEEFLIKNSEGYF